MSHVRNQADETGSGSASLDQVQERVIYDVIAGAGTWADQHIFFGCPISRFPTSDRGDPLLLRLLPTDWPTRRGKRPLPRLG